MKKTLTVTMAMALGISAGAVTQSKSRDTVIVELAKTSKVVFTMKDRSDLETLKQYDFQALFNDILFKLESTDTIKATAINTNFSTDPSITEISSIKESTHEDYTSDDWKDEKKSRYRTRHSFNFDLGTNNYLENNKFPDAEGSLYTVRPWGSWYLGFNSVMRTRVASKLFFEWSLGLSMYNFKFQEANTVITETVNGVTFTEDPRDLSFVKSKLTASYVNASFIPMLDFGGSNRKTRFWSTRHSAFRIGAGPYVGYRLESHSKIVYKEDGDKEKDKNIDNFYLNNVRYGVRMQVGVRAADFFFNYDLNELFVTNKGPKLNAFSFGVIF